MGADCGTPNEAFLTKSGNDFSRTVMVESLKR